MSKQILKKKMNVINKNYERDNVDIEALPLNGPAEVHRHHDGRAFMNRIGPLRNKTGHLAEVNIREMRANMMKQTKLKVNYDGKIYGEPAVN